MHRQHSLAQRFLCASAASFADPARRCMLCALVFAFFVQLSFAHTPSIGENEKDAAKRNTWNQYQKFVEYVEIHVPVVIGSLMIWRRTP
ncbi:MAG: hypothetical protein WCL43_05915 [Chlorobium sp.]|nr:MAG: hypothetical protein FDX12_05295 [Chlorobium sp.]